MSDPELTVEDILATARAMRDAPRRPSQHPCLPCYWATRWFFDPRCSHTHADRDEAAQALADAEQDPTTNSRTFAKAQTRRWR